MTVAKPGSSAVPALVGHARAFVVEQMARSAGKPASDLDRLAAALGRASRELEGHLAAPYLERAAEQVGRVAGVLKQTDPDEALRELERFALRRPLLFLGSALVAGIGTGRFFKSSAPAVSEAAPAQPTPSGRKESKRNHGQKDTQAAER